jgi:hypothetical protein
MNRQDRAGSAAGIQVESRGGRGRGLRLHELRCCDEAAQLLRGSFVKVGVHKLAANSLLDTSEATEIRPAVHGSKNSHLLNYARKVRGRLFR